MPLVVVKLGSSVVAGSDGKLREQTLTAICDDIAALHADGIDTVVVTSGAIARGIDRLDLKARPRDIAELQAASAVGQGGLYRSYEELFAKRNLRSAQVLLTFFDLSARSQYLNARRTLAKLLQWRIIPVINENDTTTTDEISFGDNDFLAAQVAILVGADSLILLTDTAGLYTGDPRVDTTARLLEEVSDFSALEQHDISHTTSPLGSGGMRSKVVAAEMATAAGIETVIANGNEAGIVKRVSSGERVGTRFPAQKERLRSFKLWLRFAKPTRGRVTIDDGAARALRERGTSLLPVGVIEVAGDFDAGDAVAIHARDGTLIGKGLCNYSAEELQQVKGLKSDEINKLLTQPTEEAVHRDYFVAEG